MIDKIKSERETILKGEVGALLHDIGKLHPNFVKLKSKENIKGPHHAREIDKFVESNLLNNMKNIKVLLDNEEKSIYDMIRFHHDANGLLLKELEKCDRLDSADDKGIVRKKQSLADTVISTPFGYEKEKIDIDCLEKIFHELETELIGLLELYINGSCSIECFVKTLKNMLKSYFSHALGETRIPANDVTLWDHSHSTAALFKSKLVELLIDGKTSDNWRIFGIGWDGLGFINRGKKIADILERNRIIEDIKNKLRDKFECDIPIGNVIYEDNNGINFTFPLLKNDGDKLALELSESALKIIQDESDKELWPFFLLSNASRSLASIISKVLEQSAELRKIPKSSPALYINGKDRPIEDYTNPCFPDIEDEHDICPLCKLRSKDKYDEKCGICDKRRVGRLSQWLDNRENTIWTTEVADRNNRIALFTLKFDLDRWLDGSMVGTIFSQTFEDWFAGSYEKLVKFESDIEPTKDSVHNLLKKYVIGGQNNKEKVLDSFYEENLGIKSNYQHHINNIKDRMDFFDEKNLAKNLFTQNPSPARLYRIWNETKDFFDQILTEMKEEMYSIKRKRLSFSVDESDLNNALQNENKSPRENKPYVIQIKDLTPNSILLLHTKNRGFYTIESLEKYEYNGKKGHVAVKSALEEVGFHHLAYEDDPKRKNLLENNNSKLKLTAKNVSEEEYYPFIPVTSSPLMLRMIVPAVDSARILKMIQSSYQHRFEKVIGKLPLDVGLVVSKRKFPLYVMLDAGDRMLEGTEFKKPVMTDPWWDVCSVGYGDYHKYYPMNSNEKHTLDDLSQISKGRRFSLLPGHFDFDLLLGTSDRYKINYSTIKNNQKRTDEEYRLFSGRPYYLHQITEMMELWELLLNNISTSQINNIEQTFFEKFKEWKIINDPDLDCVERKFIEAVLSSSYSSKWNGLSAESRTFLIESSMNGLLIDTISFFRHVIKLKEDE